MQSITTDADIYPGFITLSVNIDQKKYGTKIPIESTTPLSLQHLIDQGKRLIAQQVFKDTKVELLELQFHYSMLFLDTSQISKLHSQQFTKEDALAVVKENGFESHFHRVPTNFFKQKTDKEISCH